MERQKRSKCNKIIFLVVHDGDILARMHAFCLQCASYLSAGIWKFFERLMWINVERVLVASF